MGLPGYWAVLFVRAVMPHPAGLDRSSPLLLFEKIYGEAAIAFTENRTLGIRNGIVFEAKSNTAHTLACLRFAGPVTETVARLATGWAGSPLAGRVSHPLDNKSNFMESSHTLQSQTTSRAWSHCSSYALRSASNSVDSFLVFEG